MRFFNTTGPVNPEDHYCLPPLERWDLEEILTLIDQKRYFVLYAPRQTGKTSCLLALVAHLTETGKYRTLYANVEAGQSAREDVGRAMRAILMDMGQRARDDLEDPLILDRMDDILQRAGGDGALGAILTDWATDAPVPLVLMLDEVDALVGDTLISLLRQLRAGYNKRPAAFPQTVILCGVRDVRDYRIHTSSEKTVITGGGAFNIKAESLRLEDFSKDDIQHLYAQHTEETGQVFQPEALDRAWEMTQGQLWLVNALAYQACFKNKAGRDRAQPITEEAIADAAEQLILSRTTHLDQLADKLQEDRVRRVIEPILAGENGIQQIPSDDLQYVEDLGLIRLSPYVRIANPIYQEVIPRELTFSEQRMIPQETAWYVGPDGRLQMEKLLARFQQYYRENVDAWLPGFRYREVGPQLLLQAFLQGVVNGGGRMSREYALGRDRTDLLVLWRGVSTAPHPDFYEQRIVIEIKILRQSLERTIADGLEQTAGYMDKCGGSEGHLVIFDRTPGKRWEEKLFREEREHEGRTIIVWGM